MIAAVFVPGASASGPVVTTPTVTTPKPPALRVPLPPPRLLAKTWATVNVCDTAVHPDTIGIGASMPGTGRPKHDLYMRFQVQYKAPAGLWKYVGPSGDSDFLHVGTGDIKNVQAGHNFKLQAPIKGQILVRGDVTFEWRKGPKVLMRAKRLTIPGRPRTAGADPKRFTAAFCGIKPDAPVAVP